MTKVIPDPKAYRRFQHLLSAHRTMLGDPVRNRAFHTALRKAVTSRSHVLDIGAGTGVWAIAAARLGAARVVAVEKEPLMIPLIRRLAEEQGVTDRVEVVQGDSRQLSLRREFDVVVSETVGRQGFDEKIVPIMINARRRFLRSGGIVIPRTVTLRAAPVRMDGLTRPVPAGLPWRFAALEALLREVPVPPPERGHFRMLARPVTLIEVDLATVPRPPMLHHLTARWAIRNARRLDAIAVWVEAETAPGIRISTRAGTHWAPTLFPLAPFRARRGVLEVAISLPPRPSCWTATLSASGHVERQSRAPLFAYLATTRG